MSNSNNTENRIEAINTLAAQLDLNIKKYGDKAIFEGFKNKEDLEMFANETGGEISEVTRQQGRGTVRLVHSFDNCYTPNDLLDKMGDNYGIADAEYFDCLDEDDAENENVLDLKAEFEAKNENQTIIRNCDDYIYTVDNEFMSFEEDGYTYTFCVTFTEEFEFNYD